MKINDSGTHDYDDIRNLPRPASSRPPMPAENRAAQFAPYAALKGFDSAVAETGRQTEEKRELDESEIALLNRKLAALSQRLGEHPAAVFTVFRQDEKKSGGAYDTVTGRIRKIDSLEGVIQLQNGEKISIADIFSIETEEPGAL